MHNKKVVTNEISASTKKSNSEIQSAVLLRHLVSQLLSASGGFAPDPGPGDLLLDFTGA